LEKRRVEFLLTEKDSLIILFRDHSTAVAEYAGKSGMHLLN